MAESTIDRHRPWAAVAAVIGAIMLALYVVLIVSEGGNSVSSTLPWALLMATSAGLALGSVFVGDPHLARNLLIGATVLFGLLGVLSVLTIGVGFLVAAAVAAIGTSRV